MKNLIMQSVNDVSQNPIVNKVVPLLTAGTGWATLEQWLPLVAGVIASIFGAVASIVIIRINWAQHKIKLEILERDLAERKSREGRKDRRDD